MDNQLKPTSTMSSAILYLREVHLMHIIGLLLFTLSAKVCSHKKVEVFYKDKALSKSASVVRELEKFVQVQQENPQKDFTLRFL